MNFCNGSPILPSSSAHEEAQPARNRGTDHAENALVPHDVTAYRPLPRQAEMDTTVMLLDHLVGDITTLVTNRQLTIHNGIYLAMM